MSNTKTKGKMLTKIFTGDYVNLRRIEGIGPIYVDLNDNVYVEIFTESGNTRLYKRALTKEEFYEKEGIDILVMADGTKAGRVILNDPERYPETLFYQNVQKKVDALLQQIEEANQQHTGSKI